MEGQEDMRPFLKENFSGRKQTFAIIIIILFHLIGMVGLSINSTKPLFLQLVPYHLLLMLAVIIISHQRIDGKLPLLIIILFVLGYSVEWLGVNKHLLFGDYQYGKTLGLQLFGVPLMIGVNWFLLTYSTGIAMQHSSLKSMVFRILCGGLMLVLLDTLIEPVALRFDYWYWINDVIPLKNYICWFFVSAFMLLIFELFHFNKQSFVAPVLLITQFIFFAVLHWS